MKRFLIPLVAFWLLTDIISTASSAAIDTDSSGDSILDGSMEDLNARFQLWQVEYKKDYKTAKDLAERLEIWIQNHCKFMNYWVYHTYGQWSFIVFYGGLLMLIPTHLFAVMMQAHNHQVPSPSYNMGHNQFSDLTLMEFQQYNFLGPFSPGLLTPDRIKTNQQVGDIAMTHRMLRDLPVSVDWNVEGAVTPIKNQGACGSCWAYSAIGAIEGARFLDTRELVSLSEQQLVDCDTLDSGCQGGLMDNAFMFDESSTGICSEEDYPYAGRKHWIRGCFEKKGLCDDVPHTRVKSFFDVNGTNLDLMSAIRFQPVSVAIQADQMAFQFYKTGVLSGDCGVQVDHGVLAVGYGTTDENEDFWLVKNSWGSTWGDSGFIKLARDSKTIEEGMCGILTHASRPQLED